jgi:hypothetical protein
MIKDYSELCEALKLNMMILLEIYFTAPVSTDLLYQELVQKIEWSFKNPEFTSAKEAYKYLSGCMELILKLQQDVDHKKIIDKLGVEDTPENRKTLLEGSKFLQEKFLNWSGTKEEYTKNFNDLDKVVTGWYDEIVKTEAAAAGEEEGAGKNTSAASSSSSVSKKAESTTTTPLEPNKMDMNTRAVMNAIEECKQSKCRVKCYSKSNKGEIRFDYYEYHEPFQGDQPFILKKITNEEEKNMTRDPVLDDIKPTTLVPINHAPPESARDSTEAKLLYLLQLCDFKKDAISGTYDKSSNPALNIMNTLLSFELWAPLLHCDPQEDGGGVFMKELKLVYRKISDLLRTVLILDYDYPCLLHIENTYFYHILNRRQQYTDETIQKFTKVQMLQFIFKIIDINMVISVNHFLHVMKDVKSVEEMIQHDTERMQQMDKRLEELQNGGGDGENQSTVAAESVNMKQSDTRMPVSRPNPFAKLNTMFKRGN